MHRLQIIALSVVTSCCLIDGREQFEGKINGVPNQKTKTKMNTSLKPRISTNMKAPPKHSVKPEDDSLFKMQPVTRFVLNCVACETVALNTTVHYPPVTTLKPISSLSMCIVNVSRPSEVVIVH